VQRIRHHELWLIDGVWELERLSGGWYSLRDKNSRGQNGIWSPVFYVLVPYTEIASVIPGAFRILDLLESGTYGATAIYGDSSVVGAPVIPTSTTDGGN